MSLRRRWHKGQSTVELALAAPILVALLVVAADYARVFYMNVELDEAARAGAQYASQSTTTAKDTTGIQAAAGRGAPNISGMTVSASLCTCQTPLPSGQISCQTAYPTLNYCTDSPDANYVQVTASDTFQMVMNFNTLSNIIRGFSGPAPAIPLRATAIVQVQQ